MSLWQRVREVLFRRRAPLDERGTKAAKLSQLAGDAERAKREAMDVLARRRRLDGYADVRVRR